jgi:dipeptidyl aminopeptidase/acylaminoacyl peptidase
MRRLCLAALAAVALSPIAWSSGAHAAPLEAYGELPNVDHVAISPDGKNLAYVTLYNGQQVIVVRAIDDHKMLAGIRGAEKVRDLNWADSDHLLITTSTTSPAIGVTAPRQEWSLVQCFSVSTHNSVPLLQNARGRNEEDGAMNVVTGAPVVRTMDGHTIVFLAGISFVNNNGVATLFKYDVDEDRTRLVDIGTANTVSWVIDGAGAPIAREDYDDRGRLWRLRRSTGAGTWRDAFSYDAAIDTPAIMGLTPDGNALVIAMPDADDKELKLADDTVTTTADLGTDYNSIVQDPTTHRIAGTIRFGNTTAYRFFAPADQRAWNSVSNAFQDENVELVSWSADRKRIVVRIDGPRDGAVYQMIDMDTHQAAVLGLVYKDIDRDGVAPVSYISYRAADGLPISAYLTLPRGRDPKSLPLVVMPHGGPEESDGPEFDWMAQAVASRGYAVLQPQFRGSAGRGWDFVKAGFGEWGRKMQSDLSDGVRYLAAKGTIDPKRVCIMGASYGGYAALAGVTLEHGVYRCAVAVAGVSDLQTMLEWVRHRAAHSDNATMRYWERFMGAGAVDDPKLADISPLAHVANIDAPVLLIHGKDDTVVPISQSEDMADALKKAGKTARFVKLDGEDHWLSRSETRLQMLTEAVAFLEANNPPN